MAVSVEVAVAMAEGALDTSSADVAVSVTGVAGPSLMKRETPSGWCFSAAPGAAKLVFTKRGSSGIKAVRRYDAQPQQKP